MTLDMTRVAPSEYGIWRGSDYSLGLLAWTLDHGGGLLGVHVKHVGVTGLTIYHPHVTPDGGIWVP
jgi:hypothetical protein